MFDWNEHYKTGGMSGNVKDTFGIEWGHRILGKYFYPKTDFIIDVGCGDLQFWVNGLPPKYVGIDISPEVIIKNMKLYPDRYFHIADAQIPLGLYGEVVICFNVLFHIIHDEAYVRILENIKNYSKRYVLIYTWNQNPFNTGIVSRFLYLTGDGGYKKYRDFLTFAKPVFEPEFELIAEHIYEPAPFGTLYAWRKK